MSKNESGVKTEKTKSLCPECLEVIPAEIFKKTGKVMLKKTCERHGEFEDVYWSDASLYEKFKSFAHDGKGLKNPNTKEKNKCPYDCGLCPNHKTSTLLANIDLTNRCNQRCPICFANSAVAGYIYEPSFEQIKKMLETLKNEQPVPCQAVQFSGGEPTLHPDFLKIIKLAKQMGFIQIQIASNGVKESQSIDFCKKMKEAGLNTVYFQFDGIKEETYKKVRGYNALPAKLKAMENFRKAGLTSIVLVPTVVRGINDDQIGDVVKFAKKNSDVVKGVNFQPVSFSGRIDKKELKKQRITIPDVLDLLEKQTGGEISKSDFYPIPSVVPISYFAEAWQKQPKVELTVHPHCGAATYVFIENDKFIPITRFIEVEKFLELVKEGTEDLKNPGFLKKLAKTDKLEKAQAIARIINNIPNLLKKGGYSKGSEVIKMIINNLRAGNSAALQKFHKNTLFIGIMHFMDAYNFDIERMKRCGIHYATPDGRIIPFCAYNSLYREEVEKKFSRPLYPVRDKSLSGVK